MSIQKSAVIFLWLIASFTSALCGFEKDAFAADAWELWGRPDGSVQQIAQNESAPPEQDKSVAGAPVATPGIAPVEASPAYQIGPGDILDISVWKDEALSRSVVVLPDGKISFPLIGEILVGGKTIKQVKEEMTSKLTRYVPELVLSVEVKQSNSMQIYVIGRVNLPGKQVLNSRVTVLQALAMAGGLNPFASRNSIKIFRKDGEKTITIPFRYGDVVEGKNLESNIELQRGDVIVVP